MSLSKESPQLPIFTKGSQYPSDVTARDMLRRMFDAAIAAANPAIVLPASLPPRPKGRCIVVGAGKAAGSMAAAVEAAWSDVDLSGVVVAPYGYGVDCQRIRVLEAGHPVPDANSLSAAQKILEAVRGLEPDDLVLALISGGGSAAMCLPAVGLTLEDKQITGRLLLASGLDIRTMNAVRRKISAIKGGRLAAAAAPAQVITLAISDIPGDDATAIASGPTAASGDCDIDFKEIVARLGPQLPAAVIQCLYGLDAPVIAPNADGIKLIARPAAALAAAAQVARDLGVKPMILSDNIEGESRIVAQEMAARIGSPAEPTVFISGGETTVTIDRHGGGRGGRNTEFILSLACEMNGRPDIWALAADTDGEDGSNVGAAGAIVTPDTLRRARAAGLDSTAYLESHDSGSFFDALGDLVITGPTRTNVNDFRAILALPTARS